MTMTFYAQPYSLCASGFYFETHLEFAERSTALRDDYGQTVEEFEIQFIDGQAIDAELFRALGINQGNIGRFIERAEEWEEHQKRLLVIAAGELGERIDLDSVDPDDFDIDIYEGLTMRELAEQFVDEGLFGDIPEHLAGYIDYEAIARDLAMDYAQCEIAGASLIYRSA